ncbi:MAG: hypothetical protein ACYTGZ_20690 [Planctomycetota bacterium]|jgi:cytochrome c5
MNSKRILIAVVFLLALGLIAGACQSPPDDARLDEGSTVESTGEMAKAASVEPGGARLWRQTCARCHNYRRPASRTDSQWRLIVHHMRVRANIPASDAAKILRFLQAAN